MNQMIRTDRRWFLALCGRAAALTLPVALTQAGTAKQAKPNFVFILADDLGWGDLGCYGNREIRTPNLDRLAAQGLLFTQFYVSGSVCSPSRTAFMTGQFPARQRVHGHFATDEQNEARGMPNWLDPQVPTVTRLLQEAGYVTGHFGKWHLGSGTNAPTPGAYGIDEHVTVVSSGPQLTGKGESYFWARSTTHIVDHTIAFIEKHRDEPFYVNVWTLLPHATLHPTPEQMEPYKPFAPAGVPYEGVKQIYYASVSDLDRQVGRLIQRIDELGLGENTYIVFSSDNGPEDLNIRNAVHSGIGNTGPFRGRKRSLYEGGVRLPLIVRCPGRVPAGRVDDGTVLAGVDWLPTICRLAGVNLPGHLGLDGQDMSPAFLGQPEPRGRPLMWEWRFRVFGDMVHRCPMLAIREGRWKLLMNPDRSRVELYDIPSDPTELDNVASQNPDVVERLARQVLAWQKTLPAGPIEAVAGSNAYPWPKGK
ncbi:MAG: sulfatase-like hydrolase/transferase [Planctomycetes bacterium]|jgi:N-acetylgalactosamine-6-sulfatase|nr:sulfatase-like hydrolase/transferase [Planctomycetota bacterium]